MSSQIRRVFPRTRTLRTVYFPVNCNRTIMKHVLWDVSGSFFVFWRSFIKTISNPIRLGGRLPAPGDCIWYLAQSRIWEKYWIRSRNHISHIGTIWWFFKPLHAAHTFEDARKWKTMNYWWKKSLVPLTTLCWFRRRELSRYTKFCKERKSFFDLFPKTTFAKSLDGGYSSLCQLI